MRNRAYMRPLGRFGVGGIDGISGTAGKMKYCNATRRGGVGPGWRQSVHGARQSERRIGGLLYVAVMRVSGAA